MIKSKACISADLSLGRLAFTSTFAVSKFENFVLLCWCTLSVFALPNAADVYSIRVGKVKVKVFRYKPDVALGVPGG